ncbi:MAG: exonuclease domain-containing protein [Marinibacterium sp.]|nr:exonuclease domain-containing protein [Marinibacterium sp.]
MMDRFSLRLRVFLFFALLAIGGIVITLGGLVAGYLRAGNPELLQGYVFSGVIIALLVLALITGVWFLFDEHVAKPLERLAADLRARAHAGVKAELDTSAARYLGDLAPAAQAVAGQLSEGAVSTAAAVARETQRVQADASRLSALLSELPVATMMVGAEGQVVLYDAQAAGALEETGSLRLNAPVTEVFAAADLHAAKAKLDKTGQPVSARLSLADGSAPVAARLVPLGDAPGYILTFDAPDLPDADAARPLVFDFALLDQPVDADLRDRPLSSLSFTVFDTETTGLLPHKDDIVQIGAVHVLSGRIVPGEEIDQYVDPGRPIPAASTKVHGISDAMVAGAPDIATAGRQLHRFACNSVIVAHNAPFDMAFLHRQASAMGVRWEHPILDTVLLSAVVYGTTDTHTLDALCERLEITIPEARRHTALGDAEATAKVLCCLLPLLEQRGFDTLGKLLEETKRHGRLLQDLN